MSDEKWLKEALDKLESKVDKLDQRLDDMHDLHVENTSQLKEHIFRTELAEENIALLREEFKPVQKHVDMVAGALKFIGLIAMATGIVETAIKVLEYFKISL